MSEWVEDNDSQWIENTNDQWYPVFFYELIVLSSIIWQIDLTSSFNKSILMSSNLPLTQNLSSNIETQIDLTSVVELEDV